MLRKRLNSLLFAFFLISLQGCLENSAPVADAGPDRTVYMPLSDTSVDNKTRVEISGEGSFDPNGDVLMYHWVLESIPAGSQVILESLHAEVTALELDVAGIYEVSLIVDDGEQRSQKDVVLIHYVGDVFRPPVIPPGKDHPPVTSACVNCHNGVVAGGKSANHIMSTDVCESCHDINGWRSVTHVFHPEVVGDCVDCHNGVIATGKSSAHILSDDKCAACHTTAFWLSVFRVSHESVIGSCESCHLPPQIHSVDGIVSQCEECHFTYTWRPIADVIDPDFPPVGFNHEGIIEGCSSCHQLTQTHIMTSQSCESCHSTERFVPAIGVDHNEVIGGQITGSELGGLCITCHNGTVATGKTANHITSDDSCGSCHSTDVFMPVVIVDHVSVLGHCSSCHSGTVATGKGVEHLDTTDACDACHSSKTWQADIVINHNDVLGACVNCHAFPSSHEIISNSNVACDECHSTVSWQNPVNPIPANGI